MSYSFDWQGDAFLAAVLETTDDTLAVVAGVAVTLMRATAPVDTGALQASERAAEPGFAADESARYVPRAGGLPVADEQTVGDRRALVTDHAIWVGSWIYYAYWVERGTSHPNYPAQPHIAEAGELALTQAPEVLGTLWAAREAA